MPDKPEEQPWQNPIDADKITESPHNLPYAHTVGGAVIRPEDVGKLKGRALAAMEQQTGQQLGQLYDQMKVLAAQAEAIQKRVSVSEKIYDAEIPFDPIINHRYYLYERNDGRNLLSMIGPEEWGSSLPYAACLARVRLLADHTWEILDDEQ